MSQMPPQQAPYGPPGQTPGLPPRRSAWPTVIGYVSIGVAALFLLFALVGFVMQAASIGGAQARQFQENLPDWMRTWQIAAGFYTVVVYGVLILAGLVLLKRRPAARTLHFLYVVLAVIMTIANTWFTAQMMEYLPAAGGPEMPPGFEKAMKFGMLVGLVFSFVMGLAYPAFLVIWFCRGKIADEVRTWAAR